MRRLVDVLGDPQTAYPVIHLTGTNGKGSTARMITALLQAQGLSVGTYTSPHLERINERLMWDGRPIDDEALAEQITAVAAVEPLLDDVTPSYFEILTAAAFRWFADLAVDVAVVEVGLLGRWDATNVAHAAVAVVTNVGHDHTDGGPGWRRKVAEEKAGIIESDGILVLGETDPQLAPIFAAESPSITWRRDEDFGCVTNRLALDGRLLDLQTPGARYDEVFLPAHGAHQGDNAAVALAAAEAFFGRPLDPGVVEEALATVTLPGRFEVLGRSPLVILDGAHNPEGARALAATLAESFAPPGRTVFVVGMLRPRDVDEMLAALEVEAPALLIACTPSSPRAVPADEVAAAARSRGVDVEIVADVGDAVQRARRVAEEGDAIVITGSLYVVGSARAVLPAP